MFRLLVLALPLSVVLVTAHLSIADDSKKTQAEKDHDLLQGDWVLTAYTVNGEPATKEVLEKVVINFRGGKVTLKPMPVLSTDREGKKTWRAGEGFEWEFELGTSEKIRTIDLIMGDGQEKTRLKGMYAFDKDELRVCYSLKAKLPSAFESKADSHNRLLVLKRAKR